MTSSARNLEGRKREHPQGLCPKVPVNALRGSFLAPQGPDNGFSHAHFRITDLDAVTHTYFRIRDHELASLEGWSLRRAPSARLEGVLSRTSASWPIPAAMGQESEAKVRNHRSLRCERQRASKGVKQNLWAQSLRMLAFYALRGSSQSSSHLRDRKTGLPMLTFASGTASVRLCCGSRR